MYIKNWIIVSVIMGLILINFLIAIILGNLSKGEIIRKYL